MKKTGIVLLALLMILASVLSGCGGLRQIRFLTPDGGTLLPVAKLFQDAPEIDGKEFVGETVNAVAIESRLFAGTCEAAIAPVNLCAKVYQANGSYVLAGIVSWGNNYILSTDGSLPATLADLRGQVLYAWGAEAVPGKTLKAVLDRHGIAYETVTSHDEADSDSDKVYLLFMADAGSINQAMNKPDSQVRYAMLPEPSVTALTSGQSPKTIVFDMQELWDPEHPSSTYPQAGLVIKKKFLDQNPSAVETLLQKVKDSAEYCLQNPGETAQLAKEELQSVALPAVPVLTNYIAGRGQTVMMYKRISDSGVKESVCGYLQMITGNTPDDGFFAA